MSDAKMAGEPEGQCAPSCVKLKTSARLKCYSALMASVDVLACDVLCTSSLVNAPMPLLEMAAREKEYSVFGFRPSTV